jgi:hypothetical protein
MRRTNVSLWIAALSVAGIGWMLNLAVWFIELNPWGLASSFGSIIAEDFPLAATAMTLRFGREACVFAALILIATGLLEETSAIRAMIRKSDPIRMSEARV